MSARLLYVNLNARQLRDNISAQCNAGATGRRQQQANVCSALKLLSVDPQNYPDAPREGIRRILEQLTGQKHPRDEKLDTSRIASIRMGTTVSCCVTYTNHRLDVVKPASYAISCHAPRLHHFRQVMTKFHIVALKFWCTKIQRMQ